MLRHKRYELNFIIYATPYSSLRGTVPLRVTFSLRVTVSLKVAVPLQWRLFPDEFCEEYPHSLIPTPGYWVECSRQKIATDTIWDESESEHDSGPDRDNADNGKFYFEQLLLFIICSRQTWP